MPLLFWDASALVKNYIEETGSPTVESIFSDTLADNMATTVWGYTETFSILRRRLNGGKIDQQTYTTAITALQSEVLSGTKFDFLSINDRTILASTSFITRHNLNATDSAILATLLNYARSPKSPICVLIAADQRLIRAANDEGLKTLNPEMLQASDISEFLSSL